MYDELAITLRNNADHYMTVEGAAGLVHLLTDAADAIEKLSRRNTPMKITEIHVDEYYCPACGAENNCDEGYVQDDYCPVCGQRLLTQPPKDEAPAKPYDLLYEEGGPDT